MKNFETRHKTFTRSAVSSITIIPADPSMLPAAAIDSKSIGESRCSSPMSGALTPPGKQALNFRPPAFRPQVGSNRARSFPARTRNYRDGSNARSCNKFSRPAIFPGPIVEKPERRYRESMKPTRWFRHYFYYGQARRRRKSPHTAEHCVWIAALPSILPASRFLRRIYMPPRRDRHKFRNPSRFPQNILADKTRLSRLLNAFYKTSIRFGILAANVDNGNIRVRSRSR